ncbi:MAG: cupredoxin domain-containing protein [Bryobacteraceae bacterium]
MKFKNDWTLVISTGLLAIFVVYATAAEEPRVVTIGASKFQFSPSTITLKKGEPVKLQLTSEDITHGFLVKPLKIETDIVPGKTTELTITPQTAGTFRAICDHYCGPGHGDMHMTVIVTE